MRLSISDGQVLPANLIIFGQFTGQDDGSSYWLLDSNDASIRLSMEIQPSEGFTQLVPELPLAVDETYRLIFSASQNPPTEDSIERLSFSTSAPDESAPSSPIATHEINEIFPDPFGPCGPVNGETWVRFFVQPNEAEQIAIYRLLDGSGDTKDINIAPFISRDDDGNIFLSETASAGGTDTYEIVATSHAGVDSVPTEMQVNLGCPGSCAAADLSGGMLGLGILSLLGRRRRIQRKSGGY